MNTRRLAIGWLAATAIALTFAWSAVAQVRNRVIEPAVEIPPTAGLAAAPATTPPSIIRLEFDETSTTTVRERTTTSASGDTAVAPSTTLGSGSTPPTSTTVSSGESPPSTTSTTMATTTTTTSTTTTTIPAVATTTTTSTPPEVSTTTHTLIGGVVTISHSPGTVSFVAAIPQPGYSTEQRETGPEEVRIRFESESHTSDFRARWDDGDLEITLNETGDD